MSAVTIFCWNLFHGRGNEPAGRVLRDEFSQLLAGEAWDVALLQEAPAHWLRPLSQAAGAAGASVITSRNFGAALRRWVAERDPDWIKSNEGGSNQILARGRHIVDTRRLTLTLWPERRRMIWVRLSDGLTVATFHATADDRPAATEDVIRAARAACSWSADRPLIFGGDFNLRMSETPQAFERLDREFGLTGARPGRAIDHILTRGLDTVRAPEALPDAAREFAGVRLSDHAPVVATYEIRSPSTTTGGD